MKPGPSKTAVLSLAIASGNPKNGSNVGVGVGVMVGVSVGVGVRDGVSLGFALAVCVCATATVLCTLVAMPPVLKVQAREERMQSVKTNVMTKKFLDMILWRRCIPLRFATGTMCNVSTINKIERRCCQRSIVV